MEEVLQKKVRLSLKEKLSQTGDFAVLNPVRRECMALWLMAGDLLALALAGFLAVTIRLWMGGGFHNPVQYYQLWPVLFVFLLAYGLSGFYPGVGITPVEELRRLTKVTSAVLVAITVLLFLTQQGTGYSRLIFLMFWAFSLVSVPLTRLFARRFGLRLKVWGEPVALVGFGPQGEKVLHYLRHNHLSGLIPVVIVDGEAAQKSQELKHRNIPVIPVETLLQDKLLLNKMGIFNAVVVSTETPIAFQEKLVNEEAFGLRRLIMISTLGWVGGSAVVPYDLQGILGLEVERNLLNPRERVLKRVLDLLLIALGSPVVVPVVLLIALLIRLDSPGPVFYCQKRLGRRGKEIRVWKFRTMIPNADAVLEDCLGCDPELRAEWEATHKLKNDPRVTRVGNLLRRTSLDELPQLWNVIKGEMSLVGPRPIVEDEVKHYASRYPIYTQVAPGLTGLWQVSGRSDTSYPYRVSLDEYYIRHWSIWQDIYILIRTIWVVLKHNGAY